MDGSLKKIILNLKCLRTRLIIIGKVETFKLIKEKTKKHLGYTKKQPKLIQNMQMPILEWQVVKKNSVNMKKPFKTTISLLSN
jgi:hypothetical protein